MSASTTARANAIDRLLPQTQCTRCGYPACRDYAGAIASGEAGINQCPPGGETTIAALAALLGREPQPLEPANGVEAAPRVALIDEERCIGCARCLPACPVDAIVGARRFMHTVITAQCTGCELCIPPCPVDCIDLVPALDDNGRTRGLRTSLELAEEADRNRVRYEAHLSRVARTAEERRRLLDAKKRQALAWRERTAPADGT